MTGGMQKQENPTASGRQKVEIYKVVKQYYYH